MSGEQPVLVVIDDEPGTLEVAARCAGRAGFEVVACAGGREGMVRVQSACADLVMVDVRMPAAGGMEVLRAVRRSYSDCRACILADSAFITERELGVNMSAAPPAASPNIAAVRRAASGDRDSRATVEREHVQRAMAKAGGNKKAAAQMLGLSRRALYRRLERLDLAGSISRRRPSQLAALAD